MDGIRLLKSSTEKLTPDLVQRFVSMTPSIVERGLDEGRVDYLATRLAEGNVVPFNWAYVTLDKKEYRMNGQHSSVMLDRAMQQTGALPKGLIVHLDEFGVESEADMVNVFRQFDVRKSGRSTLDVANAYASVVPELEACDRVNLKLAAEGINWGNQFVERLPALKSDDRYQALMKKQNLDFLIWTAGLLDMKSPELRKHPIIAAMYKTYFVDPDVAQEFWGEVSKGGDEQDDTQPSRALDLWLKQLKDKVVRLDKQGYPIKISPAQIYQACIFAWNAHVAGNPVKTIGYDASKGFYDPKYPA